MKSMQLDTIPKRILLIIALVGSVIFLGLMLLLYFTPKYFVRNDTVLPIPIDNIVVVLQREQPSFGSPMRLKIPAINVDAVVENVGLTAGGAMDVPKSPQGVGWFDIGPHPGNIGSAVIAGHYGVWKNGEETVFNNLNQLRKGDKLSVEDDKGTIISFVVRESRVYDPEANASEVFSSNDKKPHLNLITCEGDWGKNTKSYSGRLVVFTDRE